MTPLFAAALHICWCRWKLKSVQGKWLQSLYLLPKLLRVFTECGRLWSRYLHKQTSQGWVGVSLCQNFPMRTWSAQTGQGFGITGRSETVWRFVESRFVSYDILRPLLLSLCVPNPVLEWMSLCGPCPPVYPSSNSAQHTSARRARPTGADSCWTFSSRCVLA